MTRHFNIFSSHQNDSKNKVVIHFHDDCYVVFTAREQWYGAPSRLLSRALDGVVSIIVPLQCSIPEVPAQLQDALTTYYHLLSPFGCAVLPCHFKINILDRGEC